MTAIMCGIREVIPLGFEHHKEQQDSKGGVVLV
ncbi:hypothetical protein EZS27_014376 [termite gut metagenome]|uniref:Uncharacterized protein n=1 Tax=termite gut metagenome TaxID=433724 RepID=A0A5J4RX45_9ZZZZ